MEGLVHGLVGLKNMTSDMDCVKYPVVPYLGTRQNFHDLRSANCCLAPYKMNAGPMSISRLFLPMMLCAVKNTSRQNAVAQRCATFPIHTSKGSSEEFVTDKYAVQNIPTVDTKGCNLVSKTF